MKRDELSKHTRAQLLVLAKQRGLRGISRLRKAELVARLVAAMPTSLPPDGQLGAVIATSTKQTEEVSTASPSESAPKPSPSSPVPTVPHPYASAQEGPLIRDLGSAPTPAAETQCVGSLDAQSVTEIQHEPPNSQSALRVAEAPPPALELPSTYNDNRLVLVARDPHCLYAYWDFSVEQMSAAQTRLGVKGAQPILRVVEVTDRECPAVHAQNSVDIELPPFATQWYIGVARADTDYCVEVGYRTPDGRFAPLGRSNVATTPRDTISPSTTAQWWTPPGRQAGPVPPPQHPPLPLEVLVDELGSSPGGPTGREGPPSRPRHGPAQPSSSGILGRKG